MFPTPLRVGLGAVLVVLGLSVTSGWIFGVGILTSVLPGWPNMKFNPALCTVLLGLAFILIERPRAPARIGAVICGLAVATSWRNRGTIAARRLRKMAMAHQPEHEKKLAAVIPPDDVLVTVRDTGPGPPAPSGDAA